MGGLSFRSNLRTTLRSVDQERFVTCTVEIAHLHYWYWQVYQPFILVLYDAQKHRAFWVDVQAYVQEHELLEHADGETVTLRIPADNRVTVRAIDLFGTCHWIA